jgi:hypothetical protein
MNRRAILAGAAAAAVPVPALASADPIYAVIATRKAVLAAWSACNSEDDALHDEFCDIDNEAIRTLLRTPPTTPAGIKALLRYIIECERNGEILNVCIFDDDAADAEHGRMMGGEVLLGTLLTALERL